MARTLLDLVVQVGAFSVGGMLQVSGGGCANERSRACSVPAGAETGLRGRVCERAGHGGLAAQATLEFEFLQQTLAAYETVASKAAFKRLHTLLRTLTKLPAPPAATSGPAASKPGKLGRGGSTLSPADLVPEVLQADLRELEQVLKDNRRATVVQFRCFA